MTLTAAAVMALVLVALLQARQSLGDGAGEVFGALAGSGEATAEGSGASAGQEGETPDASADAPVGAAATAPEGSSDGPEAAGPSAASHEAPDRAEADEAVQGERHDAD